MFKFCSLYSGSSGNCLFVETPYTKLLIDAGESAKKIENALHNISVDIHDIDAILVTHEHSDSPVQREKASTAGISKLFFLRMNSVSS